MRSDMVPMCRMTVLLSLLAFCGCGPAYVPVTGTVKFKDGTPLTRGTIFLDSGGGVGAQGTIGSDGSFTLSTSEPGDGMPAGKYKVIVVASSEDETKQTPDGGHEVVKAAEPLVHKKYTDLETTDIEVEVKEEGGHLEIMVEKP